MVGKRQRLSVVRGTILTAFLLFLAWPALAAEPTWQRIENCTLVADGYRDGDSFLVRIAPRTFRVFRLYFVDTCEDSADQRYPERVADQAKYFGVSQARAFELGDEAAAFTDKRLAKPFTVRTCWQIAPGASSRPRYYATIQTSDGGDLAQMLVGVGLARIYGKRITLSDGRTSRAYLDELEKVEGAAKSMQFGGWKK